MTETAEKPDHHIVENSIQHVNDKGMTGMMPEDVKTKTVNAHVDVKNKAVTTIAEKRISSDILGEKKEVTTAESGKRETLKDQMLSSLKADGVVPNEEIDSLVEALVEPKEGGQLTAGQLARKQEIVVDLIEDGVLPEEDIEIVAEALAAAMPFEGPDDSLSDDVDPDRKREEFIADLRQDGVVPEEDMAVLADFFVASQKINNQELTDRKWKRKEKFAAELFEEGEVPEEDIETVANDLITSEVTEASVE